MKKSIYSLIDLREILLGCNRRYLEFLCVIGDHSAGIRALDWLTEEKREADRPIKGLNFFKRTEQQLLRALQRPELNIHGVRRAETSGLLPEFSPATLSRRLRRLRLLGVINVSPAPTATTSPALAVPRLPPPARSPSCESSQLWPPRCSEFLAIPVKTEVVRD